MIEIKNIFGQVIGFATPPSNEQVDRFNRCFDKLERFKWHFNLDAYRYTFMNQSDDAFREGFLQVLENTLKVVEKNKP